MNWWDDRCERFSKYSINIKKNLFRSWGFFFPLNVRFPVLLSVSRPQVAQEGSEQGRAHVVALALALNF